MSGAIDLGTIKRGASFDRAITLRVDGVPMDLSAATVRSELRKGRPDAPGELVQELDATITATPGRTTLRALPAETALWEPGKYVCDARFAIGSSVTFTKTFVLTVMASVTQ